MTPEDEAPWYRTLLVSLGAMLGVAVVVGGLVGLVVLGAVKVTDLGEQRTVVEEEPTLTIPERRPSGGDAKDDGPTLEDLTGIPADDEQDDGDPPAADDQRRDQEQKKPRRKRSVISLSVSPLEVSPMQRIDLTGTYPGGEGATLQVQRFEAGWSSFAGVTATVRGETFSTYVMTGRTGPNRFRVVDPASGKSSNPVRVRIG
jgi:hypothetical protein